LHTHGLKEENPHLLNSVNFCQHTGRGTVETPPLDVLDEVYTAADNKQVTVLIGLDLSAAFDTINHEVLL